MANETRFTDTSGLSFETFVKMRQKSLERYAKKLWGRQLSEYECKELVVNASGEIYDKLLEGSLIASFEAVAISLIAKQGAKGIRKQKKVNRITDAQTRQMESRSEEPDESTARTMLREEVQKAVSKLSKRQREVLERTQFQDTNNDDTAQQLGIKKNTVKVHSKLGIARLRTIFSNADHEK